MENSYRFLKISGRIFEIVAWIALAFGAIATLVILIAGGGPDTPRAIGIVALLVGGLYFLIFKTVGEMIRLLLDLESRLKS